MGKDYIGKGWAFPPSFDNYNRGVEMVSGEEEIRQSLKILFSTNLQERLFHPDFGCDLRRFQFSPNNRVTLLHIQQLVKTSIRQFESRITLNSVDVNIEEIMEGKLIINLNYTINSTNSQYNMVYPYYFK